MVTFTTDAAPAATALNHVRLSNGITLHFATQGPATGPAIVMLHGFTDSWFSFSRVLPLLPPETRIVAPGIQVSVCPGPATLPSPSARFTKPLAIERPSSAQNDRPCRSARMTAP